MKFEISPIVERVVPTRQDWLHPSVARSSFLNNALVIWLLLCGIMAAGAFLRAWQINEVGFNSDEAVYAGQAAAIVGVPELEPYFPMFRAHPMLFHTLLASVYSFGIEDVWGRYLVIALGVINILLVYKIGKSLYGAHAGLLASLFMALMPYHVIVSRQVLLDGPKTTFATLVLYLLVRFGKSEHPVWLYAAGAALGLTFLVKETGIILLGSIYMFLALASTLRVRLLDLLLSFGCFALIAAAHPLAPRLAGAGGAKKTGNYIIWQLFRRPNHDWSFYPTTVTAAIGPLLILLVIVGLWLFWRRHSWRETLMLSWIAIPTVFFQLWPVKGFHYLLIIASPLVVLAARTLTQNFTSTTPNWITRFQWRSPVALLVAMSLLLSSWSAVQTVKSDRVMAGGGGVPGGRELGEWISQNVPEGAVFMTLGPSMANIIQFYGHRRAYGLSVSPNPLHRNPSYEPIINPDRQLRTGELHYVVWDSFSAARSSFFEFKLFNYADRYHGRVIHREFVMMDQPSEGAMDRRAEARCVEQPAGGYLCPIIIVYEVRP